MTRQLPAALAAIALAVTVAPLAACTTHSTADPGPAAGEASPSLTPSTGTIELNEISAGRSLTPATYAMPLVGPDNATRAVVEVPAGYFSTGGWFIDDGHGELVPNEFGDLSFWGAVDGVDTDPCL